MFRRAALATWIASAITACGGQGVRDVALEGQDVHATDAADAGSNETYHHVAQRPRVSLGLAEARRLEAADARELVERLATAFEGCAEKLEREGSLPGGAGRVVAVTNEGGVVVGLNVRSEPGADVTRVIYVCLVAPLRATTFPAPTKAPPDAKPQGIALEVAWKPIGKP